MVCTEPLSFVIAERTVMSTLLDKLSQSSRLLLYNVVVLMVTPFHILCVSVTAYSLSVHVAAGSLL